MKCFTKVQWDWRRVAVSISRRRQHGRSNGFSRCRGYSCRWNPSHYWYHTTCKRVSNYHCWKWRYIIESRYPSTREHGNPVHLRAANEGNPTKIGPNGNPLSGEPELTPAQQKVVNKNLKAIKKVFRRIQKWIRHQPW